MFRVLLIAATISSCGPPVARSMPKHPVALDEDEYGQADRCPRYVRCDCPPAYSDGWFTDARDYCRGETFQEER